MKKITIILIIILVLINIALFTIFSTTKQINQTIDNVAETVPANTIYLNSNNDMSDTDNSTIIENIKLLDGVTTVTAHDTYAIDSLYYDDTNQNTDQLITYRIPVVGLETADQLPYPIISGRNVEGDGEIVVSSSFVEHLGKKSDEIIGDETYSMTIVGVYQDPIAYQEYNLDYGSNEIENTTTMSNQAYTIDSKLKDENKNILYYISDTGYYAGEERMQPQQIIEVTFDNDNTEQNLQLLVDNIGEFQVYFSSLGLTDMNKNFNELSVINSMTNSLARALGFIDIVSIIVLIIINRKGTNGIFKKSA